MDKKYRNNLLNGQHLENDQDDLGNVITKYKRFSQRKME